MRYLLMVTAFMMTATAPLFAQMDGCAPESAPVPTEKEVPEDGDKKEDKDEPNEENPLIAQAKEFTKLLKGIDTLLKGNKVTQETIDAYIKHNSSFDKLADKDEEFEKLKDVNIVEAYNHVIKQEWFKKWGVDNKVEDGEKWLKNSISILLVNLQVDMVPELKGAIKDFDAQIALLAKEDGDEAKEAIKAMEDQKKGFAAMIKAAGVIPQLSDAEVKLIEKNADAIERAADEEVYPDEEDDDVDDDDMG